MVRGRDSGMPPAEQWESYFDAAGILEALGCSRVRGDAVEFGCGYGTFTIPAAHRISGTVYALDIDPQMAAATAVRVTHRGLNNVIVEQRDFVTDGCGRAAGSMSYAMLFNILHIEDPVGLLTEARRVVRPGGRIGVIHWNYDARTPRGPPLSIRPRPEQCRAWAEEAGLIWMGRPELPGAPWHWGTVLESP
jgi:SAM-dependent methyltransferase